MRQQLGLGMQELEDPDQAFHAERHHDHEHEARQEAAQPGGRTHMHFALHLFFEHGLAQFEGGNGNRQEAHALEDQPEALLHRLLGGRTQRRPDFDRGEHDEGKATDEEEQGNEDEAQGADFLQVFHEEPLVPMCEHFSIVMPPPCSVTHPLPGARGTAYRQPA